MHIGSQITEAAPFADAIKKVAPLVRELRAKYGIQFFSIGGGLGIVYESSFASGASDWWIEPTTPSPQSSQRSARSRSQGGPAFAKLRLGKREAPGEGKADARHQLSIQQYVDTILPTLRELKLKILLEPGRLLVGNAGVLLTRVRYIKQTGQKRFAIVDAGMNDLIRPALYHSYHEIIPLLEPKTGTRAKIDIVGPVCESGDFLALDREMPKLREDDLLAIMSAGAYGFVMASNYNSRPLPAEVLVRGDKFALVRKRQSAEDLVTGEVNPRF
jgi:diaminopimelate decarboxylase